MRQLKDLGLIIAYELHGFRIYSIASWLLTQKMLMVLAVEGHYGKSGFEL